MQDAGYALGRALVSILFVVSGFSKFMDVGGISRTLAGAGFPQPRAFGYAVAAVELVGGLLLLVGWKTRWVGLALFVFTAGTIIVSHHFWDMAGAPRAANQIQALKNLSIMGGLLVIACAGAGRFSLDRGRG